LPLWDKHVPQHSNADAWMTVESNLICVIWRGNKFK
jgi:hypothetical protein